ncbi:MAG: hypothetical protein SGPRY_003214 [Prymnesium sp.]
MGEGQLDEAEKLFGALARRSLSSSADAMNLNNLGVVHMRQRRFSEAISDFKQALAVRQRYEVEASTSRGVLELGMIQRNLATAERLAPVVQPAVKQDGLDKLSLEEIQVVGRRLGVGPGTREQMVSRIRQSVGNGDVDVVVQLEMIHATFDVLDLDGDGQLTKVEVLKALRGSDKVKKLLELPEKLFPDEGGKRSNKKLVDHVFDEIDRDGGGTITAEEFKSFCILAPMRANEVAFFAGETAIEIVPRIKLDTLQFICGDISELKPNFPAEVPLWLAIFLRKRDKCQIVTPAWLSAENLQEALEDEKRHQDRFAQLPYHYIEIAKELLAHASEDIEDVHKIRSVLADIEDHRRAKVERGLRNIDADSSVVRLSNLGAMELNRIRSVAALALDNFRALDVNSLVNEAGTGAEVGTGAGAGRAPGAAVVGTTGERLGAALRRREAMR